MRDSDLDRAGAMGTYMGVRCAAAELPEHRWVALNTKVSNGLAACLATMDDFPGLHLCHEVAVKRYVSYLACLVKNEPLLSCLHWGSVRNLAWTRKKVYAVLGPVIRILLYKDQKFDGCNICGASCAIFGVCDICLNSCACANCHFHLTAAPDKGSPLAKVRVHGGWVNGRRSKRPANRGDAVCLECAWGFERDPQARRTGSAMPGISMRQQVLLEVYAQGRDLAME